MKTIIHMNQTLMTATEVAEYLRMGRSTIYKMVGTGEIPYHRKRGRIIFIGEEIVQWVKSDTNQPETPNPTELNTKSFLD